MAPPAANALLEDARGAAGAHAVRAVHDGAGAAAADDPQPVPARAVRRGRRRMRGRRCGSAAKADRGGLGEELAGDGAIRRCRCGSPRARAMRRRCWSRRRSGCTRGARDAAARGDARLRARRRRRRRADGAVVARRDGGAQREPAARDRGADRAARRSVDDVGEGGGGVVAVAGGGGGERRADGDGDARRRVRGRAGWPPATAAARRQTATTRDAQPRDARDGRDRDRRPRPPCARSPTRVHEPQSTTTTRRPRGTRGRGTEARVVDERSRGRADDGEPATARRRSAADLPPTASRMIPDPLTAGLEGALSATEVANLVGVRFAAGGPGAVVRCRRWRVCGRRARARRQRARAAARVVAVAPARRPRATSCAA